MEDSATLPNLLASLFTLFEARIYHFTTLSTLVDDFRGDLNLQRFSAQVSQVTTYFQEISARIRDIESRLTLMNESKLAARVRAIQELERRHLELRVQINERLVKLALGLYELNKRRVLS